MKFKTQICTTKEQSERLLALGLKAETADMYHYVTSNGTGISVMDDDFLPHMDTLAWSLHRLIEIYRESINASDYLFEGDAFEKAISNIEWLIEKNYINKEYIE